MITFYNLYLKVENISHIYFNQFLIELTGISK